jgi:radical SAM protein with 4Fe4S-binding SPASM domain
VIRSLEFTFSISGCLDCVYCPQSKLNAQYKSEKRRFTFEDFYKVLGKLPADVRVDASGYSEPFLNPIAALCMRTGGDAGREVYLYSTLVGLTDNQAFHLKHTKLAYVRLHLPDTVGLKISTGAWLRYFDRFLATGHPFSAMAMGPLAPDLAEEMNRRGIQVELPEMINRAGNAWQDRHIAGPVTCNAERWHQNVILPNGDVYLCCCDYGLQMSVGNLLTQTYDEIHAASESYRQNLNPPEDSPCRKCTWARPV